MRHFIGYLIVLLVYLLVAACSEEVSPAKDNFVVEGFIIADRSVDNIKIKNTSPIESSTIENEPIGDAVVQIITSSSSFSLDYNLNTQLYENTNPDLKIIVGESYTLEVTRGERTASGITTVPEIPTGLSLSNDQLVIPPIIPGLFLRDTLFRLFEENRLLLEWDSEEGQSYFVVIEHLETQIESILPPQIPDEAKELLSGFRFISAPSEISSFEIIGVALETYGTHVAKVFSVNQEYVDLYNSAQQDSRDLNEPPSNIVNAQGIFTAFALDSIIFEVTKE